MNRPFALCTTLLLLATSSAMAETVYRRVDAEGNVTFSSAPPKPGEKAEKMEVDPNRNVVAPHSTPETQRLESQERGRYWEAQQNQTRHEEERNARIAAAEARLEQARSAQQAGQALQPGDLIGKQSGGTRPSAQRSERLQRLDDDVKAAEAALEEARSTR